MAATPDRIYSRRLQGSIYGTAFFTGNLFPMSHVVMPLWAAIELDASLSMVGLIIASRQLLPITMSIHGGALLDRFGPRRVIIVLGVLGALSTAMVPFLPFIWATILLQIIIGFCETTNWIGVQSAVGTLMKGKAVYAGRMTASARIGGMAGLLIVGSAYDAGGAVGGFLCFGAWAFCGVIAAFFLPVHEKAQGKDETDIHVRQDRTDVLPSLGDYRETFRLLLIPAVALVIAATFMRQTGSGVQASFYAVWLKDLGYTATTISLLIAISNGVSAGSALTIGPLTRRIADYWLLILAIGLAVLGIAATPLLEGFFVLAVAISLRGVGQGLNLPLMMSIASRAVTPRLQGRVAALRISFNRLGGALFPLIMGVLADHVGLDNAFYIIGATGFVLICGLSVWVARTRDQFNT